MICKVMFKNTVLFLVLFVLSCGNSAKGKGSTREAVAFSDQGRPERTEITQPEIITGAQNTKAYLDQLKGKKVGVVTNQTGIIKYVRKGSMANGKGEWRGVPENHSIIDYFLDNNINVIKIFAPEHGFRGTADAGEHVTDGKDLQTGLPVISLYGDNKKPKADQLAGLDILVFDLQDVGARFYTYISSLHYIMEACAENNIPLIILDRPNPNGGIVDGPILEPEFKSFVGMHAIPILHGMTIGEYGKMINGQKWLKNGIQCKLQVIPCLNYNRNAAYSLPVKPSPNLPNDQSINLYASLCLFEGTNVSVGRGTDKQFQIYGSPYLAIKDYNFTPTSREGAKDPPYKGKICFGEDLSSAPKVGRLELKWLIKAYQQSEKQAEFFNPFFSKLAGTKKLQMQIQSETPEAEIRKSWEIGLSEFKKIRKLYEIY